MRVGKVFVSAVCMLNVCVCMYSMFVCVYVCMLVDRCLCVCVCVCACVCVGVDDIYVLDTYHKC